MMHKEVKEAMNSWIADPTSAKMKLVIDKIELLDPRCSDPQYKMNSCKTPRAKAQNYS